MTEPNLRLLRVFIEVAERLSFTRAAETLYLRQQTVSRMVRDLEREVGVELLERSTREVRVTPAGQVLLEQGRTLLRSADAAYRAVRATGTGEDGIVRIGASVAIGSIDRVDAVRALREDRPTLSIAFREVTYGSLGESLHQRWVDYALTRTWGVTDSRLDSAELRATPALVCIPAGHRLAGRDVVSAAEFDGERLLVPSPVGTPYTDMVVAGFRTAGAVVSPVQARVTGGAVLLDEVAQQHAVAVMPTGSFCPPGVVGVPVEDFSLPLRAVWLAGRVPDSLNRLRRALAPIGPA